MDTKNKKFLVSLSEDQYERLRYKSYSNKTSMAQTIRDMIEDATESSISLEQMKALKTREIMKLNDLSAEIRKLETSIEKSEAAEPVKDSRFEKLFEEAVTQTTAAIGRGKENIVADGNASNIRSFGFKISKNEILDEAYRRVASKGGKNGGPDKAE